MHYRTAPLEVQLFALGYLHPHEVDTLQLVDSVFCSFIEEYRGRKHILRRHELRLTFDDTRYNYGYRLVIAPRLYQMIPGAVSLVRFLNARIHLPNDEEKLARVIDNTRVCCVYRLDIRGDLHRGWPAVTRRLLQERIPVRHMTVWNSKCYCIVFPISWCKVCRPEEAVRLARELEVPTTVWNGVQ
jgi:hypothetical protein